VHINKAGGQALPLSAETLVLRNYFSVIQRIFGESEAIGFQPVHYLHFTGKPL
jgi:hypothetical protein